MQGRGSRPIASVSLFIGKQTFVSGVNVCVRVCVIGRRRRSRSSLALTAALFENGDDRCAVLRRSLDAHATRLAPSRRRSRELGVRTS